LSNLFISHAEKDKHQANQVADILRAAGYEVWIDNVDIRVGDSIPEQIERGLIESDFVVVIMSKSAVQSQWVRREWESKYWDETEAGTKKVLPVLLEDCEIPSLLRPKKYADCRQSFVLGMHELLRALEPFIENDQLMDVVPPPDHDNALLDLIRRAQSHDEFLSAVVTDALLFAKRFEHHDLAEFCHIQLKGLDSSNSESYNDKTLPASMKGRVVEGYLGVGAKINTNYIGYANDPNAMWDFMENDQDFQFRKVVAPYPLSQLEHMVSDQSGGSSLYVIPLPIDTFVNNPKNADVRLPFYMNNYAPRAVLNGIRNSFVQMLLDLLREG